MQWGAMCCHRYCRHPSLNDAEEGLLTIQGVDEKFREPAHSKGVNLMKLSPVLAAILIILPTAAFSKAKVVECAITSLPSNEVKFKGKCRFLPEAGGSFTLMDANGKDEFYDAIGMVSVNLTGKITAEVSGLVLDEGGGGHNSRWGEAKRSQRDAACWDGEDFRVCAW